MARKVANIDRQAHGKGPRRTGLVGKPGFKHASQPEGRPIGIPGRKSGGYSRSAHQSELLGHHKK